LTYTQRVLNKFNSMKNLKFISIIILLIANSCKKKTAEPATPAPPNVTSTYETGLIDLLRAQYFDGTNMVTYGDNVFVTFINYDNTLNSSVEVSAGNVTVNGTGLKFDGNSYDDTTYVIDLSPATMSVTASGSSHVNGFSTTFNPVYPSFTGDALLPLFVSKSVGCTINLGNSISNVTDTTFIQLFSSNVKKIAPGQTTVTFTPADLSGMSPGSGYFFEMHLYNRQTLNVNGRAYYVRDGLQYIKYNIELTP
jgi:hypothetical protein